MARRSLEQKRAQLQAQLQDLEQFERDRKRPQETRMRIVLGGAMLAALRDQVEQGVPEVADGIADVRALIEQRVTRPADARARELLLARLDDLAAELVAKAKAREAVAKQQNDQGGEVGAQTPENRSDQADGSAA
jgi:hypothetical protein